MDLAVNEALKATGYSRLRVNCQILLGQSARQAPAKLVAQADKALGTSFNATHRTAAKCGRVGARAPD